MWSRMVIAYSKWKYFASVASKCFDDLLNELELYDVFIHAGPSDYEENTSEWDSYCQSFESEKCQSDCEKNCKTGKMFGTPMVPHSGHYI